MNLEKNPNPTILVQRSQKAEPQSTLLATSSSLIGGDRDLDNHSVLWPLKSLGRLGGSVG